MTSEGAMSGQGRKRTRNGATEHQEQAALFRWATFAQARWPELGLLHAIPNGGQRNKIVAARLKAEGVRPGVPDLCLPVARGRWHGLYIELKALGGRPSKAQRQWIRALRRQGYRAELCVGWTGARRMIEDYLNTGVEAGRRTAVETLPANGERSHG
ncbi:MAG: VRR-NUC domain-containing protein [Candidatus Thiodiazotropha sp.]